jgi:hypothetical protein
MKTNAGKILTGINNKLKGLEPGGAGADKVLRAVSFTVSREMGVRIHEDGQKSDSSPIGNYTTNYLKRRQQSPYNRTSSNKIILSLTGQMESDFTAMPISNNRYGIGFKNNYNADKAEWAQERFGKIYNVTDDERKSVSIVGTAAVNKYMRK